MNKRHFLKTLSFFLLSLFNSKILLAIENSKIINPNLTDEQKRIMFGEGTERAGTSPLNFETVSYTHLTLPTILLV